MPIKHMPKSHIQIKDIVLLMCYKHVRFRCARNTSHSNISNGHIAVAHVSGTSEIAHVYKTDAKPHMQIQDIVLLMIYKHARFRCARNTSHSNISNGNVAVARVSGTSKIAHAYKTHTKITYSNTRRRFLCVV